MAVTARWFDKQLIKTVYKVGTDAVKKGCFMVEGDAKYFCPVDTGRLRASISSNWQGSGMARGKVGSQATSDDGVGQPDNKSMQLMGVVGTNVEYAARIEYGFLNKTDKRGRTFFQPATPYLRTALHKNEKKIA